MYNFYKSLVCIIILLTVPHSGFSQNSTIQCHPPNIGKQEDTNKRNDTVGDDSVTSQLTMGYLKGVYSITLQYNISSVKLYMHIPVIHRKTTPVFFRMLESLPSGKIIDYKTVRKNYNNWIAEVTIGQLGGGEYIIIPWECWTLKKNNAFTNIPDFIDKSLLHALDDSLDQYLQSSVYIQSNNSKIIFKAEELAGSSQNIVEIVNSIIDFTGNTIIYKGIGVQDALSTLQRGYAVCTGKANLAVALLRAIGIPARVLMVAFTHYIAEFYLPDYGWVRGESTQAVFPQPVECNTVMMACTQFEENYSGQGGVMYYWGTPYSQVSFNIEYFKTNIDEFRCQCDVDDALLLQQVVENTQRVWRQYNTYLNYEKSSLQDDLFAQALSHQEQAVSYFGEDNIQGYVNEIQAAQEKYNHIMDLSSIADKQFSRVFKLFQNHPNPFNSSTQICYSLASPGQVRLILYDIRGREIKTLVDEFQSTDTYSVTVKLNDLPSGVYLYKLSIGGDFSEIKKMLLVR